MSNCRLKYAKDITDNIIKESNLDNTSAIKLKENVNQYLLPIGGKNGKNEKLQTIKNTYEWAKSIQDWANNHYDSKRLGNTVYINDDPQGRGTIVTIMMPKLLIDAYENKFGQMSNEDFNSVLDKKEYYDALDKAAVEDSIKNDKQDTHLREKYFAKNDESPASRILRRISKTSHPLAKLAEKLESYVSINDVTIKLVPKIKYTDESAVNNSAGVYYHNTNSIEIAEYANFPAALAESVLIHEIIHALTVKQLRSNSTVNKDFTDLYEYVKTKLPAYDKASNTGTYATTSLDEFMVGIFTDANFIKQLKDIPPFKGKNKYKNFFEEVFNTILNALGIKTTDNVYEEAFSIASNIIEDARESSLANELYNQSSLGIENEFNSNQQSNEPKVNFDLKVVNKIESNISKINGWFKQMKDTDQFWKKVQSDLAIPKEQVELLRQSEGDTIEQKLVDFVSKYSYTVKIKTTEEEIPGAFRDIDTGEEYSDYKPTDYYQYLTVPGGTNYTERNFETPLIKVPKSHAQFNTENTIGFTRGDDRQVYTEKDIDSLLEIMQKSGILKVKC